MAHMNKNEAYISIKTSWVFITEKTFQAIFDHETWNCTLSEMILKFWNQNEISALRVQLAHRVIYFDMQITNSKPDFIWNDLLLKYWATVVIFGFDTWLCTIRYFSQFKKCTWKNPISRIIKYIHMYNKYNPEDYKYGEIIWSLTISNF